MNGSVFQRLGGFARVRLLVSDFYEKVLASDRLARHFSGVDVRRLVDHQTRFISAIMGGPASYTDEQIARAHARLGITADEFGEMAALFRETLEDFGLDTLDIERLHAHLLSLSDHVVTGSHAPR